MISAEDNKNIGVLKKLKCMIHVKLRQLFVHHAEECMSI